MSMERFKGELDECLSHNALIERVMALREQASERMKKVYLAMTPEDREKASRAVNEKMTNDAQEEFFFSVSLREPDATSGPDRG